MCNGLLTLCLHHQGELRSWAVLFTAVPTVPGVRLPFNKFWLNKLIAEQMTDIFEAPGTYPQ